MTRDDDDRYDWEWRTEDLRPAPAGWRVVAATAATDGASVQVSTMALAGWLVQREVKVDTWARGLGDHQVDDEDERSRWWVPTRQVVPAVHIDDELQPVGDMAGGRVRFAILGPSDDELTVEDLLDLRKGAKHMAEVLDRARAVKRARAEAAR